MEDQWSRFLTISAHTENYILLPSDFSPICENKRHKCLIVHSHLQTHKDSKLQKGAVIAIKNLIDKNDLNTTQRLMRLNDLGAVDKLEAYLSMTTHLSEEYDVLRYIIN